MADVFKHPILGELKPKNANGVKQFLGLKYASIKNRLAVPELYTPAGPGIIDATQHGHVYSFLILEKVSNDAVDPRCLVRQLDVI